MRASVRRSLWRWRRNPLRRRSDVLEGWARLFAALLVVVGAPAAGWAVGDVVDDALHRMVRSERAERSHVTAALVQIRRERAVGADEQSAGASDRGAEADARWRTPDGAAHTGIVRVTADRKAGDRIRLWTDSAGRLVLPPMEPSTATTQAVLAGVGVALAAGGTAAAFRQALLWQFMRRRMADWGREWAQGPQSWGRADAGG
jgi:F0F1-type ATP synthase membrane subunit c/vacuolar-type H+-ATPase subunit K